MTINLNDILLRLFLVMTSSYVSAQATSALDPQLEQLCMDQCASLDIALVSVAHRPSVLPFHQQLLYLTPAPPDSDSLTRTFLIPLHTNITSVTIER